MGRCVKRVRRSGGDHVERDRKHGDKGGCGRLVGCVIPVSVVELGNVLRRDVGDMQGNPFRNLFPCLVLQL